MIAINKAEKEVISTECPEAHIVRTMKQKSKRHRYYCEESPKAMAILKKIRCSANSRKVGAEFGNT